MNNTTKYGLFFLGGVVVGALGAVAITRGKLNVKPLAADLLSTGLDLRVFEDAITFKIALMVVKYMKYMESMEN